MGFLNTDSLPKLVDKLSDAKNIKVENNANGTRVSDVIHKITQKADEITVPVEQELINDTHSFKVGTGQVNVSSDVVNGFSNLGIKGDTYHNLEDTKKIKLNKKDPTRITHSYFKKLKLNTMYTYVVKYSENKLKGKQFLLLFDNHSTFPWGDGDHQLTMGNRPKSGFIVGNVKTKVEFGQNLNYTKHYINGTGEDILTDENSINIEWIILVEGNHKEKFEKNTPIFFDGITGVGDKKDPNKEEYQIDILSNNTNLINDGGKEYGSKNNEFFNTYNLSPIFDVFGSIEYTLSFDIKATKLGNCRVYCQNGSNTRWNFWADVKITSTEYSRVSMKIKPTLEKVDVEKSMLAFYSVYGSEIYVHVKNLCLEFGVTSGYFSTHRDMKMQFSLDKPLMKLRDVYDEITPDGNLIRRIGSYTFTGKEHWSDQASPSEEYISFLLNGSKTLIKNRKATDKDMCSSMKVLTSTSIKDEFIEPHPNNQSISDWTMIRFKKTTLKTQDSNGVREWLKENLTTLYFVLEKPIVTKIDNPSIRLFENGTIAFDTILAPTSTHVVQLNKSAQIERNVKEVQELDYKVGVLENFYDDMILENNRNLSVLNFDFDLAKGGK